MIGGSTPAMPPHWIGAQIMMGNREGIISVQEEDMPIMHFCTPECFQTYIASQEFKERGLLADQDAPEEDDTQQEGNSEQ